MADRPTSVRAITAGVAAAALSALPSLLLSGLAVLVRADLKFSAFQLGVAIAVFFSASALLSVPAAALSERIGPRIALLAGGAATTVGLLGVAVAQSWAGILPGMVIGGTGSAICQTASNHLLARQVRPDRQGVAYGVKQSAVPIAGILAGLALPTLGLTVGWRATFLVAALLLLPVGLLVAGAPTVEERRTGRRGDVPVLVLIRLAAAAGLGTAAGSALTTFTVVSAMSVSFNAAAAGLLLTAGSLVGVLVRVGSGWLADRLRRRSLLLASGLVGLGALGCLALALSTSAWVQVTGTLIAFGGCWGYQALVLLTVARTNPRSPSTALGLYRVGPSVGAILGPAIFGLLVDLSGYPVAWLVAAVAAACSSLLMFATRPALRPYRLALQPGDIGPDGGL